MGSATQKHVSIPQLSSSIFNNVQERKDLAFTLKDTKTIVGKLRTILGLALHFIFIMFYLLIFAVSVSDCWSRSQKSTLLHETHSAKEILKSIIFEYDSKEPWTCCFLYISLSCNFFLNIDLAGGFEQSVDLLFFHHSRVFLHLQQSHQWRLLVGHLSVCGPPLWCGGWHHDRARPALREDSCSPLQLTKLLASLAFPSVRAWSHKYPWEVWQAYVE